MLTIEVIFASATRQISLAEGSDFYGGATIDSDSVQIQVTGIDDTGMTSDFKARIDFAVDVQTTLHTVERPFLFLTKGTGDVWSALIPRAIIAAAARTKRLPFQLVLTDEDWCVNSRNTITLDVTRSINALGTVIEAYGPYVMFRDDSWAWKSTFTYKLGAVVTYGSEIYVSLADDNVGNTPSHSSEYWHLNIGETGATGATGASTTATLDQENYTITVTNTPAGGGTPTTQTINIRGATGATGATGEQGPQGPGGVMGPRGEKGETGSRGPQGPQGEAGPIGPQGLQGPQGEKGETGTRGPQGLKGDTGATGAQGISGASVTASLDQSAYTLTVTNTPAGGGTPTTQTINVRGATGAAGATGEKGEKGETGATGEKGVAGGYIFIKDVGDGDRDAYVLHRMNTLYPIWQAVDNATNEYIHPECTIDDANGFILTFDQPYGTNAVKVLITAGLTSAVTDSDVVTFGNGTDTSYTLAHRLATTEFLASVRKKDSAGSFTIPVITDVRPHDLNSVDVTMTTAPAVNSLRLYLKRVNQVVE